MTHKVYKGEEKMTYTENRVINSTGRTELFPRVVYE